MSTEMSASAVAQSTGPEIMGDFFILILYGVLCSQTWTYYQSFPKDPLRIKILVSHLLIVGTVQAAMIIHDAFITFGTNFGDLNKFEQVNLGWFSTPILTVMASTPVQLYYAYRMTLFSEAKHTRAIAIVVAMISIFSFITSIIAGARVFQNRAGSVYKDSFMFVQMWLVSDAACDVIITVTMIALLTKSNPQLKQTRQVVSKLVRLFIESGFVTAAITIVDLCVFMAFPSKRYHSPICDGFANLHSLTLLVILNYRPHLATTTKATWDMAQNTLHFAQADERTTTHDDESSELSAMAFSEMFPAQHRSTRMDPCLDSHEQVV